MREPIEVFQPPQSRSGTWTPEFETGADIREVTQEERDNFEFKEVHQLQVFGVLPTPSSQSVQIGWRIDYDGASYIIEQIGRPEFNRYWYFYGRKE